MRISLGVLAAVALVMGAVPLQAVEAQAPTVGLQGRSLLRTRIINRRPFVAYDFKVPAQKSLPPRSLPPLRIVLRNVPIDLKGEPFRIFLLRFQGNGYVPMDIVPARAAAYPWSSTFMEEREVLLSWKDFRPKFPPNATVDGPYIVRLVWRDSAGRSVTLDSEPFAFSLK